MDCTNHTKCPSGYIQWHPWAEKKNKTHRQIKCSDCSLYKIWIPRETSKRRQR